MTPPRTITQVKRMARDLLNDGLYPNEIAQMLKITEPGLELWISGKCLPTEKNFARLVALHEARGLANPPRRKAA